MGQRMDLDDGLDDETEHLAVAAAAIAAEELSESDETIEPAPEENLTEFLKNRRAQLCLSQEAVARRARLSLAWYQKIEQQQAANPSADKLARIALALKLDETGLRELIRLARRAVPPRKRGSSIATTAPNPSPQCRSALDLLVDTIPSNGKVSNFTDYFKQEHTQRPGLITSPSLIITARDRVGLAKDLTTVVAEEGLSMLHLAAHPLGASKAVIIFTMQDVEEPVLERIQSKLEQVRGVERVGMSDAVVCTDACAEAAAIALSHASWESTKDRSPSATAKERTA